jgi:histidinol-phosphatase (PHP family)
VVIDYHVHPDFSQDASGDVLEFCLRARSVGLEEICFTTHYEPDPARSEREYVRVRGGRRPVGSDWTTYYLAAIEEARRRFPDLVVLGGVEVGYEAGLDGLISDFLAANGFDFVLGAVHCLDHVAITAGDELPRFRAEYEHNGPVVVAERYFGNLRAAAGSGLFDCLAHIDIYRKYIQALFDRRFTDAVDALLEPALRHIARTGTGIEVNTSALRRGAEEPYPATAVLRVARRAGVDVFTTGSDAHKPDDVGEGLGRAERILADLGVVPARFRRRARI